VLGLRAGFFEQFREEKFSFGRDMVRELQVLLANIGVELLILPSERELAAQESEQKYSERPDISRRS